MVSVVQSPQTSSTYLSVSSEEASPNQSLLPLTAAVSTADHLVIGGCDVSQLIQQFGSPLYILDEATFRAACQHYRESMAQHYPGDSLVIYASKAWNCLAICAIAHTEDIGIDVVSGGELFTAVKAGVPAERLYFHGNNKSAEELQLAIETGCRIVVDNWHELQSLPQLLATSNTPQPILLRLTPGIECHTHEYIRTGHLDSKFGFDPDQIEAVFRYVSEQPMLECIGLHAHIGSQIFELQPHADLAGVMVKWMKRAADYQLPIRELDIGGGLG
ncbi:MAG: alanine racemase, partial [Cyanobacteria bacterium P01_H01_bin.58]